MPLFSIEVNKSWRDLSTTPKSDPWTMEIILNWSYYPTQIILVLSLLSQIPRPYGQSDAIPDDVK